MDVETYNSPLASRYASEAMRRNFSDRRRFTLWRRLWLTLARCQQKLGLPITDAQIEQIEAQVENIDFEAAARYEAELRHDVMAHVHALGDQAPEAKPIIHLGATSCYITDNSELCQIKEGLGLLRPTLVASIAALGSFARTWRDHPTLGFTHLQPAQPTTVGKRACLWIQDLASDLKELERHIEGLPFRGAKGTTGTQASFLALFDGDHEKVRELDRMVTDEMGFEHCVPVTGQTYSRKVDFHIVALLAGIAQTAAKFANDIRLLAHMKEIEEPFEAGQVGSSAMPYKRNPMRCERISGLARFTQSLLLNPAETASTQGLARTLDDSANRRLALSEAFLATDAILQLVLNVASGLVVHPKVIQKHLVAELPFMATEMILMAAVREGGDRQELHEALRVHSIEAGKTVKDEGKENDFLQRLAEDPLFVAVKDDLQNLCDPQLFIGRATEQVDEFLAECIDPLLESRLAEAEGVQGDVRV